MVGTELARWLSGYRHLLLGLRTLSSIPKTHMEEGNWLLQAVFCYLHILCGTCTCTRKYVCTQIYTYTHKCKTNGQDHTFYVVCLFFLHNKRMKQNGKLMCLLWLNPGPDSIGDTHAQGNPHSLWVHSPSQLMNWVRSKDCKQASFVVLVDPRPCPLPLCVFCIHAQPSVECKLDERARMC